MDFDIITYKDIDDIVKVTKESEKLLYILREKKDEYMIVEGKVTRL